MERVASAPISLEAYRGLIGDCLYDDIVAMARQLAGLRVVHLNATPRGGGVAEILNSLVPLMQSIGIDTEWYVLTPDPVFFEVTKKLHNMLQGKAASLSSAERQVYLAHARQTAEEMRAVDADIWVVHDPQPQPIIAYWDRACPAIWRCHIDTSRPNAKVKRFLMPYLRPYDRLVFTMPEFVFPGLEQERVRIVAPALNPFTIKNTMIDKAAARAVLTNLGIDPQRPLMTQVSRFDYWKDPVGVVDAYRMAKRSIPELQLALVGVIEAQDDPEALRVLSEVTDHAGGDPDIHLYWDPHQVGHGEVNAFQTASDVVVQKSIREGFALTVTEAMWKGTPVVGSRVGGIVAQIQDGENGFLVSSIPECADRVVALLRDPALARRIGEAARESARNRYLIPRLVLDELRMFSELLAVGEARKSA
jgi:trehalose synthase